MEALYEKTIAIAAVIHLDSDITSGLSASRSIAFKTRHKSVFAYEQWVQRYMDELNEAYENMTDQFISDGQGKIQANKKLKKATKAFDRVIQKGLAHQEVPAAYQKADEQLKTGLHSFEKGIGQVERLLKRPDQEKLFISATHHLQDGLQRAPHLLKK